MELTIPAQHPAFRAMLDLPGWPVNRLMSFHVEDDAQSAKPSLLKAIHQDGLTRVLPSPDWRTVFNALREPPDILVLDNFHPDAKESALVLPCLMRTMEKHTPKTVLIAFMPPKVEKVFKFYAYARWKLSTTPEGGFQLYCIKNAFSPTQCHIVPWSP